MLAHCAGGCRAWQRASNDPSGRGQLPGAARGAWGGAVSDAGVARPLRLLLLGGFSLRSGGEEIELPVSAQRLVALLALRERPLSRAYLAGVLWPEFPAARSLADLRTVLWRANHGGLQVVTAAGSRLSLRPDVQVDVRALMAWGRAADRAVRNVIVRLADLSWIVLSLDLLPDWRDEWLLDDREEVRQLRLHALEELSGEFSAAGRHAEAIQAALAAVRLEPLRETAHAALIRAHLAEGNRSEALRQYDRCRNALAATLAVEPSESIRQLISGGAVLSQSKAG